MLLNIYFYHYNRIAAKQLFILLNDDGVADLQLSKLHLYEALSKSLAINIAFSYPYPQDTAPKMSGNTMLIASLSFSCLNIAGKAIFIILLLACTV